MDNNNFNVKFIELAKYETPVITEGKREDWVMYGEDNNYFQYLIDRYTYSPTNNAIINNIIKLVYGRGLNASDASKKPQQYAQFMTMFNKDCVRKMIMDSKMLGQFAIQVHYSKDHSVVKKAYHIPVQLLRPEKCNKDGEIEAYYYSDNWEDTKNFPPKRIPSFGTSKEQVEILYVRPYSVGMKYFALVDYQGALPYAVLEQEISDYLINEVQNGFSGTKVINFNNGLPPEEEMDAVERKVLGKLTGSKGKRVIVSFNHSEAQKTTVDDIPLNDAPEHYTYLSEECMRKIMLGHNVTSPLLFGISSSNGFSSNADELQNSFILYYNMVIQPYQDLIIEALDRVLAVNGISLKLYFETLKPLEFTDPSGKVEEPTELSSLDNEVARDLIALGEDVPDNWLLIDESPVDYDNDDAENELLKGEKKSLLSKLVELVSTGTARPNSKSGQDAVIDDVKFITRYVYAGETSSKSRPFCKKMIQAAKIYRKEDIIQMEGQIVNAGFGEFGTNNYSIWLHKGGARCHHRWNKQVYASFEGTGIDVNSPKAKQIAVRKAEKFGYVVKNDALVSTRPIDTNTKGFSPNNPNTKKYWS
jgi:hypothetical protein